MLHIMSRALLHSLHFAHPTAAISPCPCLASGPVPHLDKGRRSERRQFIATLTAGISPSVDRARRKEFGAAFHERGRHFGCSILTHFRGFPTRINAFAVFDMLYGMKLNTEVSPQMVEGAQQNDGRRAGR